MRRWADHAEPFGRWNPTTPRLMIAAGQAWFAWVCWSRHNLGDLYPSYQLFGNMTAWAWTLAALSTLLVFAPRGSLLLLLGLLGSSTALFTAAGLITAGAGTLPSTGGLIVLAISCLFLFARAFRQALNDWGWYQQRKAMGPPWWLRRQKWFQKLKQKNTRADRRRRDG